MPRNDMEPDLPNAVFGALCRLVMIFRDESHKAETPAELKAWKKAMRITLKEIDEAKRTDDRILKR